MNNRKLKEMRRNNRRMTIRRLFKNKVAVVSMVIILVMILLAVVAPLFFDYDTDVLGMSRDRLVKPCAEHPFGTDSKGRDLFARVIYGARASLTIGLAATALLMILGTLLGAISAYFGGIVDNIIMRVGDTIMCIPGILLALALIAALGTSMTNLMIALVFSSVPGVCRMVRSVVLNIVGQDFVEAARATGMSSMKIIVKHIIPNAVGLIIVEASMGIASCILSAASLSFIGMGIQPPTPEWGSMLSDASANMRNYPHLVIFPGLAIVMTTLSFNLFGDGLRDALDPMLKD